MTLCPLRLLAAAAVVAFLTGCAGAPPARLRPSSAPDNAAYTRYLDETTAVTVSAQRQPLVFYKEEPQLGAHARDYVSIGPIEINRTGARSYYVWLGAWSTIDRRFSAVEAARQREARYVLIADDREIALADCTEDPAEIGTVAPVYEPPTRGAVVLYCGVAADVLRSVAGSAALLLRSDRPNERPFRLWEDERAALRAFIDQVIDNRVP